MLLKRSRGLRSFALLAVLALALVATSCGGQQASTGGGGSTEGTGSTTQGGTGGTTAETIKIALLLPETATSARYEAQDRPRFEAAVKQLEPNAEVLYSNAQGDSTTQQQQVEAALTNGAKVLVLDPVDAKALAPSIADAKAAGVPVISYDRLITGTDIDYYISFDNERVGELQGQFVADHAAAGGTVVMINGAETDNNALLFAQGAHKVLDPLFDSSKLVKGYESFTPDWLPANGQREMEQALTSLNNKVAAVLSANDGLAGAIIQALQVQGLAGKIPVTGQDATDDGLRNIVLGTQSMTVYKAVPAEAEAAAKLAVALAKGEQAPADLVNGEIDNGVEKVPSVLLTPVVVSKENIADTVIADNFTTWDKFCTGDAAALEPCASHK